MTSIELSNFIRKNYPATKASIARRGAVYGVGINDSDYDVSPRVEGKKTSCPAYTSWKGMLSRSYSKRELEKYPTYVGTEVCDEWKYFSSFRSWWLINHREGYHLDKDILTDLRKYSPESCVYVPAWLNGFILDCRARRGGWPIGVYYNKADRKFIARCCNQLTKKTEYLGSFDSPAIANHAWLLRKLELAAERKHEMDIIDGRIYQRVVQIIKGCK